MDGEAQADFLRARIGFCVLPPMTVAGQPARITHVDGTLDEAPFPESIAPQLVVDGTIKPVAPFEEMASLAYEVTPGLWANVAFEGDIFEMEDQRNWTDASYKIYSTPLRLPWPVQVRRGDRVQQSVTLRLQGDVPASAGTDESAPMINVAGEAVHVLPELGLGMASHGQPLTAQGGRAVAGAQAGAPARRPGPVVPALCQTLADRRVREAASLGAALEVALFVDEDALGELDALLALLHEMQPRIARWIVFDRSGIVERRIWSSRRGRSSTATMRSAYVGGGDQRLLHRP